MVMQEPSMSIKSLKLIINKSPIDYTFFKQDLYNVILKISLNLIWLAIVHWQLYDTSWDTPIEKIAALWNKINDVKQNTFARNEFILDFFLVKNVI